VQRGPGLVNGALASGDPECGGEGGGGGGARVMEWGWGGAEVAVEGTEVGRGAEDVGCVCEGDAGCVVGREWGGAGDVCGDGRGDGDVRDV